MLGEPIGSVKREGVGLEVNVLDVAQEKQCGVAACPKFKEKVFEDTERDRFFFRAAEDGRSRAPTEIIGDSVHDDAMLLQERLDFVIGKG